MKFHLWPAELREQLDRAVRLEEERRRAEQEASRLETERMEAIIAKEELERQTMDQIRSQEQLVSPGVSTMKNTRSAPFHVMRLGFLGFFFAQFEKIPQSFFSIQGNDSCLIFWPSLT